MPLLLKKSLFLFLCVLVSCNGAKEHKSKKESKQETLDRKHKKAQKEDSLIREVFTGTFLNLEYYTSILKHKSPYLAQAQSPYFIVRSKPSENNKDLYEIMEFHYNQTEISSVQYYQFKGYFLEYDFEFFDGRLVEGISYKHKRLFTIGIDKIYNPLQYESIDYNKYSLLKIEDQTDYQTAINQFITKNILVGNYSLLDSSKNIISKNIFIDKYGKIHNCKHFKRAVLWDNFREVNSIFEFDVLNLVPSDDNSNDYFSFRGKTDNLFKFEYTKDLIKLRSLNYNEENQTIIPGNINYYLIKNKIK